MYLAGKVAKVLESRTYLSFGKDESTLLRLAALLHDIGHGPFSHMFEEVMSEKTNFTHEDMTERIVRDSEVGDIIQEYGFERNAVSSLAIARSRGKERFMNDIIAGGLSVDLMDYLPRDAYFTGVEYGKVDVNRIINSLEVVENQLAISEAAKFAFEALIIARYEMFRAVYFHRAVRAGELMLIRSMLLADKELNFTDLSLQSFLSLTDEVTLGRIRQLDPNGDSELVRAKSLANDYYCRRLLKCIYEKPIQSKNSDFASNLTQKKFRDELAQEIANGAKVDKDEVFVDAPTAPSVPLSSAKESLEKVVLVKSSHGYTKPTALAKRTYEMKIEEFPLVNAISGYLDIVRVYTSARKNERFRRTISKILGPHGALAPSE
jgi:uncharacterized protein